MAQSMSQMDAMRLIHKDKQSRLTYPWADWFNGEWWLIVRGEDYVCTDKCFRNQVYMKQTQFGPISAFKVERGFFLKGSNKHGDTRQH